MRRLALTLATTGCGVHAMASGIITQGGGLHSLSAEHPGRPH